MSDWKPPGSNQEKEYRLNCSVCGDVAIVFKMGSLFGDSGLIYEGITHKYCLGHDLNEAIFSCLEKKDIARLHEIVKVKKKMEDGLDAYCPECDKIYCKRHYEIEQIWDDGYYDFSYGTCPEGHKRVVDD